MEKYFLTAVLSLLAFSIPVKTQQPLMGLIQGRIVDQKHAPIPNATLTVTNIDAVEPESSRRTTGTDDKGFYEFIDVPEGRYSIIVKKKGYRDYEIPEVTLRGSETLNMPEIKMSPAAGR